MHVVSPATAWLEFKCTVSLTTIVVEHMQLPPRLSPPKQVRTNPTDRNCHYVCPTTNGEKKEEEKSKEIPIIRGASSTQLS